MLENHKSHISQILNYLYNAKILANINKCKYHFQKNKFFDIIIFTKKL